METINLDMTPSTVTPNAHAGQYDSARTVRFMLKNGGVPFTLAGTETITAEITRSDNTEVTVNVANTSSNYVDVVFDDTVCTVKGLYACELRLKDSDGFDIGSKNFALLVQRDPYDGAGVRIVTVGPADICTFETTLPEPLQSVIVDIVATGGNGTPDNPNPIVGYTEANITRCGVNLWDEVWEQGYYDASGNPDPNPNAIRSKNFISIKPSMAFYWYNGTDSYGRIQFYDENKTWLDTTTNSNRVITTPNNCHYIKFSTGTGYGGTYKNDLSILYPSAITPAYHAYNGQTYAIAFGQTVYGGVLDVTRGKLRVTHSLFDGATFISPQNNNDGDGTVCFILASTAGYKAPKDYCLTNMLKLSNQNWNALPKNSVSVFNAAYIVVCSDTPNQTLEQFKTWFSNNVQLLLQLATPFDIDLTPEVISAVVGTNNVFAGCGETTVKYLKAGG